MKDNTLTDSEGYPNTIQQKYEVAKAVSVFETVPIYTALHTDLGYRYPKPWILGLNAAALIAFPIFFPALAKPIPFLMPLFGIVTLALGLLQRNLRWRALIRGQIWHSMSNGIAHIERIKWWPEYLRQENRLIRFVEPLLVALVGLIVAAFLSRAFGVYLFITANFMWLLRWAAR